MFDVVFYAVLLQNFSFMRFTLFCREICFVAIHALWRGEKLSKHFTCGVKRTNMKYVDIFAFMDLPIYVQHLLLDVAFQYPASMPHITTLSSHSHYASTFSRPAFQVVSVCHTHMLQGLY